MIFLYKAKAKHPSTGKVERFLKQYKLSYQTLLPSTIISEDIYKMLLVSDKGFESIVISKDRGKGTWEKAGLIHIDLQQVTIEKMAEYLVQNTRLLKLPILFDEHQLMSGYNKDEIRSFIPKTYRCIQRSM